MMKSLVLFALLALCPAQVWAFSGRVDAVHDGDTITVDGTRVRLQGIDAPELKQRHGPESRDFLAGMVLDREVHVDVEETDKYGRKVAWVSLPDGTRVNAEMVKAGQAWVYRKYCRDCPLMRLAETAARWRGLGLWADPRPKAPWQWRKQHRRP